MFKKIHSNRDPKDTLLSEIKKEFGPYFKKVEDQFVSIIKRNPKVIFLVMLVVIFTSIILSFTVFRNTGGTKEIPNESIQLPHSKAQVHDLATGGFDQILRAGGALKETIKLKQEIEVVIAKKDLTAEDSVFLEKALIRLEQLNKSLK